MSVLTLLKGLPTSYNRDLQEDKEPLFDTVDTLVLTLPAVRGAIETADFRPERMTAVMDAQLLATDLADYLVRRGVPFRTSHEVVGRLVRISEERGIPLSELSLEEFRAVDPIFESDVHAVFDWRASIEARDADGGTSARSVRAQLAAGRGADPGRARAARLTPPRPTGRPVSSLRPSSVRRRRRRAAVSA